MNNVEKLQKVVEVYHDYNQEVDVACKEWKKSAKGKIKFYLFEEEYNKDCIAQMVLAIRKGEKLSEHIKLLKSAGYTARYVKPL